MLWCALWELSCFRQTQVLGIHSYRSALKLFYSCVKEYVFAWKNTCVKEYITTRFHSNHANDKRQTVNTYERIYGYEVKSSQQLILSLRKTKKALFISLLSKTMGKNIIGRMFPFDLNIKRFLSLYICNISKFLWRCLN